MITMKAQKPKAKKLQKFIVSKGVKILSSAIVFICSVVYIVIKYFQGITETMPVWVGVIGEVMLVVISVFGTNLLLSVLIETRNKNALFSEFLANDILSSPEFYDHMTDENKRKMADTLNLSVNLNGNYDLLDMSKSVQEKLVTSQKEYFFEKCSFDVSIKDEGKYFEKIVNRRATLCPYEDSVKIDGFSFLKIKTTDFVDTKPFSWKSISINGTNIDVKSDIEEVDFEPEMLPKKNGYDFCKEYRYKKPIWLKRDKKTNISLTYIVRCPKTDIISAYRAAAPCKNFSVHCSITPEEQYKLSANAFGFIDNANKSATSVRDNELSISFENWSFQDDGVCIVINEK